MTTMKRTLAAVAALPLLALSGCGSEPERPEGTLYIPEPVVTETVTAKPSILTQSSTESAKQAARVAMKAASKATDVDLDMGLDDAENLLDQAYAGAKKAIRKHRDAQQ